MDAVENYYHDHLLLTHMCKSTATLGQTCTQKLLSLLKLSCCDSSTL